MNDDLKRLRTIWVKELPGLSTEDQRHLLTLDAYLTEKRGDDNDAKAARAALQQMKESATKRLGFQNALAALPKFKDLDGLLGRVQDAEIEALGFPSATIRSLVAKSTANLSEDDVAVEFTRPIAKPKPRGVDVIHTGEVKREIFFAAAGAAALMALGLVGMALYVASLRKAVAAADARARSAALSASQASIGS